MRKTETLRQLTDVANGKHVEHMHVQLETLRQATLQSAEELAAILESLAQAMAALADQTRATLTQLQQQRRRHVQALKGQSQALLHQWARNPAELREAAQRLTQAICGHTAGPSRSLE